MLPRGFAHRNASAYSVAIACIQHLFSSQWISHPLFISANVLSAFCDITIPLATELLFILWPLPRTRRSKTKHRAVIVTGAETLLGRALTLKLAQQGYTVFALSDIRTGVVKGARVREGSEDVSSLLYDWHNKKENTEEETQGWGTVVPIALQLDAQADRIRARETITAFCSNHIPSLETAALVVLPQTTHPARSEPTGFLLDLTPDAKIEALERSMISTFVIQDCMEILQGSRGRVIFVADCADRDLLPTPGLRLFCRQSRMAALQSLRMEANVLGVVLCEIQVRLRDQRVLEKASDERWLFIRVLARILEGLAVANERVVTVITTMVESPYPSFQVNLGLHPLLQRVMFSLPFTIHIALWNIIFRMCNMV